MACFNKSGSGWRVRVRKSGQSHTATFPLKRQAEEWAAKVENEIISGKLGRIPDKTFGDLLERYQKEVTPTKRGSRPENLRLDRIRRDEIAKVRLEDLKPDDFTAWMGRRKAEVSNASILREITTMSHACSVAMKEWKWLKENPVSYVRRPPENPPRQRLITQDEIDRVLLACGEDYSTKVGRVGLAFSFALETAMRAGEICSLTWDNVFDRHVHLPITKNGASRDVPLSQKASEILVMCRNVVGEDTCFGLTPSVLDALFRRMKERAGVSGFTFHDTRRVALTKMADKLDVLTLARVSGHRDLRILSSVYYAPSPEAIADKLNR